MEAMRAFELKRPTTLAHAAALLAEFPQARLIAGGTDLVPNLRRRLEQPPILVDLSGVAGFDVMTASGDGLVIGGGVTLARIAKADYVARHYRAVAEAASNVAAPGHRSVATIGGNLCLDTRCAFYNHSEWWRAANGYCLKRGGTVCHVAPQGDRCHAAFSGDLAPALLALRAEIELTAARGTRRIGLADLYRDDGAAHLTLARDEVLARVLLPKPAPGTVCGYRKARVRGAIDFPLAGVACALTMEGGVLAHLRVALTGTNSQPIALSGTDALVGRPIDEAALQALGKLVQKQASPMRTTITQANYRRQVAAALAQRLVRELSQQAAA